MPPFSLPEDQLQALAGFVRSMNATAFDAPPDGDTAAGERFFFGKGQCASCHTAMGRGKSMGPDLCQCRAPVHAGRTDAQAEEPDAQVSDGYGMVSGQPARRQHGPRLRP